MRPSRRQTDELRAVSLERGVVKYAEGSCFVKFGDTHVLVTASLEERLPPWLKGQGRGWVTAEYGMLPRATSERTRREASAGKQGGRTRRNPAADRPLAALGGRLAGARRAPDHHRLRRDPGRRRHPHRLDHRRLGGAVRLPRLDEGARHVQGEPVLRDHVAAVSCGVYNGTAVLDLDYAEDSEADTDANFVMTGTGNIVEVQATAEKVALQRGSVPGAAGARAQGHRASSSTCRSWR